MDSERITSVIEVLQNLTVDQQLPRCRIIDRKPFRVDKASNSHPLSSTQAHEIALPQLPDRRLDMLAPDTVFVLSVRRLCRSSRKRDQVSQYAAEKRDSETSLSSMTSPAPRRSSTSLRKSDSCGIGNRSGDMLHVIEVVLQETVSVKPQHQRSSNNYGDRKAAKRPKVLLCELSELLRLQ